jgi:hypothetical protein
MSDLFHQVVNGSKNVLGDMYIGAQDLLGLEPGAPQNSNSPEKKEDDVKSDRSNPSPEGIPAPNPYPSLKGIGFYPSPAYPQPISNMVGVFGEATQQPNISKTPYSPSVKGENPKKRHATHESQEETIKIKKIAKQQNSQKEDSHALRNALLILCVIGGGYLWYSGKYKKIWRAISAPFKVGKKGNAASKNSSNNFPNVRQPIINNHLATPSISSSGDESHYSLSSQSSSSYK